MLCHVPDGLGLRVWCVYWVTVRVGSRCLTRLLKGGQGCLATSDTFDFDLLCVLSARFWAVKDPACAASRFTLLRIYSASEVREAPGRPSSSCCCEGDISQTLAGPKLDDAAICRRLGD